MRQEWLGGTAEEHFQLVLEDQIMQSTSSVLGKQALRGNVIMTLRSIGRVAALRAIT